MSKLIATKIYTNNLPDNKIAVSFIAKDNYAVNLFVNELQNHDLIELTAKPHKESRSVLQNKMLWGIIGKISEVLNGESSHDSTMKIYAELLVKANVKYEFMLVMEKAKHILDNNFRAVIDMHQSREVNGVELKMYKVFIGSSKFNTKEMTELIDLALLYATEVGVVDSEIEVLRGLYEK